ncbi:MAG: hypothetical protein ACHP9Y_02685 [Gammaproteobacteria bacterium]
MNYSPKSMVIFILISFFLGIGATLLSQHLILPFANRLVHSEAPSSHRVPELKVLLDPTHPNSSCGEVLVWKSTIAPQQNNQPGLSLHRHNYARFLIPLTTGTLQRKDANGKETLYSLDIGQALFLPEDDPNGFHTDENLGATPIEVVVVQFNKNPPIKAEKLTDAELKTAVVMQ